MELTCKNFEESKQGQDLIKDIDWEHLSYATCQQKDIINVALRLKENIKKKSKNKFMRYFINLFVPYFHLNKSLNYEILKLDEIHYHDREFKILTRVINHNEKSKLICNKRLYRSFVLKKRKYIKFPLQRSDA